MSNNNRQCERLHMAIEAAREILAVFQRMEARMERERVGT